MSKPVVAFFNSQSGVGKTTLVYHLAWMYADLGLRVLAVDLDPQANLTMAFLNDARLESLWNENRQASTVYGCFESLITHLNAEATVNPHLEYISEDQLSFSIGPTPLALLPGDLSLALLENTLSEAWFRCSSDNETACRLISTFWQIIQQATDEHQADIVLIDTGSSLGSINCAALIAAEYVVLPFSEDLLTLQGLQDSGTTMRNWKTEWQSRLTSNLALDLPPARMHPLGYIFIRPLIRLDRPVVGDKDFATRLPAKYREHIEGIHDTTTRNITDDSECLAVLKNYQALMPLAQEAHKPIFLLKPADGAIGSLLQVVQSAYGDFRNLAEKIAERAQVSLNKPL